MTCPAKPQEIKASGVWLAAFVYGQSKVVAYYCVAYFSGPDQSFVTGRYISIMQDLHSNESVCRYTV